jgi:hypothetical protein
VATVRPVELAPDAAIARRSRAERSKLRRELGRLDAICLLIAAIVVLDTLGAVAKGGAQALTLLAVVALLFFVPAGLVIAELGAAFPNRAAPMSGRGWPSGATPGRWSRSSTSWRRPSGWAAPWPSPPWPSSTG